MSGNVILDNLSKPEALGLSKLVGILSRSTRDNDIKRALEALGLELNGNKQKQRETGQIVFEKPEMNLRDWLETLRRSGVKPKYNMHYREINNRTEINTNKASYVLDEDECGKQAVEEMLAQNPRADEKDREKAYYEGVEEARKRNRDARKAIANWDIIEKDGENDTREEDPLIRYIDRHNNKIDWYSTMRNLADYGRRSGYSEGHYKRCIDRWVTFFCSRPKTNNRAIDSR
jgi:transposase